MFLFLYGFILVGWFVWDRVSCSLGLTSKLLSRLVLELWISCFYIPSAGTSDRYHHTHPQTESSFFSGPALTVQPGFFPSLSKKILNNFFNVQLCLCHFYLEVYISLFCRAQLSYSLWKTKVTFLSFPLPLCVHLLCINVFA